jgi:drug/metabolite transporter (DMT)-like permease
MLAVSLRFASICLFGIMNCGVKYLGGRIPVGEMIGTRSLIGILAIVLIAWRTGNPRLLRATHWRFHALRSSVGAFAVFTWYMSLTLAPIADATAMIFMGPIFSTLLAALLLRERIKCNRWLAVALGFGGALVMTGPSLGRDDAKAAGLALALACAVFAALGMIFLRQMSRTEHPLTTTLYFSVTSLAGAALTAFSGWPLPTSKELLLLIFMGLLGTSAQFLLTAAFRYAEASVVIPMEYTSIVVATLLGYVLFHEIPGVSIWLGAPLVIVAGLLLVWGEYRPVRHAHPSALAKHL